LSDLWAFPKLFDIMEAMKKNIGSNEKIIIIEEIELERFMLFCYQIAADGNECTSSQYA